MELTQEQEKELQSVFDDLIKYLILGGKFLTEDQKELIYMSLKLTFIKGQRSQIKETIENLKA